MKTMHAASLLALLLASAALVAQKPANQPAQQLKPAELSRLLRDINVQMVLADTTAQPRKSADLGRTGSVNPAQPGRSGATPFTGTYKMAKIINSQGTVDKTVRLKYSDLATHPAMKQLTLPADANLMVHRAQDNKVLQVKADKMADGAEQKTYFFLPEVYEARNTNGAQVSLRPAFFVSKTMRFEHAIQRFEGVLNVFLIDKEHPSDKSELLQPVMLTIRATDAEPTPEALHINHTNLPDTSIRIAMNYPLDSVRVHLLTSDNPEGYPVSIPVSPAILLSNGGHALQGFGIEQTEVTVTLRGVSSGVPVPVSLIATNGIVSPTEITLKPGEVKKVFFRSRGTQQGTLRAHSSGNDSEDMIIHYRFPWAFLLAALLGGVTGAWFNFKRQPASTPKQEKHAFGYYLQNGIPMALFAALLYAIGVNVLEGRFPTYAYFSEAVTLAFSALVTSLNIDIFAPFRK